MQTLDTLERLLFIKFAQKQLNNAFEIPTGLNEIEWLRELKNRIDSCDDEKVKSLYLFHALYDFEMTSQISKFGFQKFRQYQYADEPSNFQHYSALFFEAFIPAFLLDCIDILKLPKYYRHFTRFCLVTNELFENGIVRLTDVKYHEMMLVMMIRFNIEIEQALEEGSYILESSTENATPIYHFNSKEVTNFYSCLHAQYKLVATILQCFIHLPICEISDTFKSITYVDNIILKLDHHHVPLGCIIEGSVILSRIVFMDSLRAKKPELIFDNLKSMLENLPPSRLYIPILSAFLMDLPYYLTRFEHSPNELTKINELVLKYGDCYENKSDSKYLYLLGTLYTVWAGFIYKLLSSEFPNITEDDIGVFNLSTHKVLDEMLRFTFIHFSSWSVPQISSVFKGAMIIHVRILLKESTTDFIEGVRMRCDNFFKLGNPQVIYQVYLMMYEIMDHSLFLQCFGRIIFAQSISTYLESFILGSDAAHLDLSMNYYDEFDESDGLNETLTSLYQATNRNNDLVAILNLRYKLFASKEEEKFVDELRELFLQTDSMSELLRRFFLNKILPKLIILFKKEKHKNQHSPGALLGRIFRRIILRYHPDNPRKISVRTLISILRFAPKFEQFGSSIFDGKIPELNQKIQNLVVAHFDIDVRLEVLEIFVNDHPAALKSSNIFWHGIVDITIGVRSVPLQDRYFVLLTKFFALITSPKSQKFINGDLHLEYVDSFFKFICELPRENADSIPILTRLKTIKIFLPFLSSKSDSSKMNDCLEILKKSLLKIECFLKHSHDDVRELSKYILLFAIKMNWIKRKEVHRQRKKWEINSWEGLSTIHPSQANHSTIQLRLFIETQRPFENREDAFLELLNNKLIPECDRRVKLIQKKETNTLEHPTFAIMCLIRTIVLEDLSEKLPNLSEKLVNRLIGLAISTGKAVLPVVVDDSPEGHLPLEERESGKTDDELHFAAQKYLLNSWMTIRESVLLVVGLFEKYPSPSENVERNISCNQAQEILNYMFHNQISLVHRGAFELSSDAMNRLIQVFDRKHSNCEVCDDKLMNLTENVFTRLIKTTSDDRMENITRRSAGFPGFIQAIFAVLPEIGTDMMSNLLTLIETQNVPKAHWQVVHTFNIFRTLVQDSKLTDHISKMMERILVLCVKWFNYDPNWIVTDDKYPFPIRNACSMLFSVLMTKIFGVKRNKQDTSPKNRMFSQLFFQAYPAMFGLLLETLTNADSKTFLNPSLYVLSRITPSKVNNDTFEMSDFLPPLKKIVENIVDQPVRKFAAKIYAQLLAPDYYKVLWNTLNSTSPKNGNCFASLLLINEILPAYSRDCQVRTVRDSLIKERKKLLQNMFNQAFENWNEFLESVPFGVEGMYFQMLFNLFTVGNLTTTPSLKEMENIFNCSVLSAKREFDQNLKWLAIEKSTIQAAKFFFIISMFQEWQFLDILLRINSITEEYGEDCRLFCMNVLKEVFFIAINSTKKIQRIERERDDPVFDIDRQELIDYIHMAFDNDLIPSQFFKMIFSPQFTKSILKNLLEFIVLISGQHDYLLKRKIRTEIINEILELIYIRLQAISVDEVVQMLGKSKSIREATNANLTTLFDIGLTTENIKILLNFIKEDRPIVKHIRYSLLSVICLSQKSWTWNRDREIFFETIQTLVKLMNADDPYIRLVVMRCAYNLFYEVFESPFHPWREGRVSVFVILFRLFKVILNAASDGEREIAREASVCIRKMFNLIHTTALNGKEKSEFVGMFPHSQDGTLTMGSTIIQSLLSDYFKYVSKIAENGKPTDYPGIEPEISLQFTFNELIFFEYLIASINSLDMIYEIASKKELFILRNVFSIRPNGINGQPIHRSELKRRFSILMTKEEELMADRVLTRFEDDDDHTGITTELASGIAESLSCLTPAS